MRQRVGSAVGVGNLDGVKAQLGSQMVSTRESRRRAARDRRAGPGERRARLSDRHQRVQAECLVRRQHFQPERARAVPDHRPVRNGGSCDCDLRVGDGQQHCIESFPVEAPPERPRSIGQCSDERLPHPPIPNDRQ